MILQKIERHAFYIQMKSIWMDLFFLFLFYKFVCKVFSVDRWELLFDLETLHMDWDGVMVVAFLVQLLSFP